MLLKQSLPKHLLQLQTKTAQALENQPAKARPLAKNYLKKARQQRNPLVLIDALESYGDAAYFQHDYLLAIQSYQEALDLVHTLPIPYHNLLAKYYQYLGDCFLNKSWYELSIEASKKSLYSCKIYQDPTLLASNYHTVANAYEEMGNLKNALLYRDSTLTIDQLLRDTLGIASDFRSIGMLNIQLGYKQQGLEYLHQALQMLDKNPNKRAYCLSLNTIGVAYGLNLGEFDKGKRYLNQALALSESLKDTMLIIARLINLGDLYNKSGNLHQAEDYLLRASHLAGSDADPKMRVVIFENMAELCRKSRSFAKSNFYNQKALQLARQYRLNKNAQTIYLNLVKLNKGMGKYATALQYAESYYQLRDSIQSQEARQQASIQTFRLENQKREAALKELQILSQLREKELQVSYLRQRWLGILSLASILLALAAFVVVRQKQKNSLQAKELKINHYLNQIEVLRNEIGALAAGQKESAQVVLDTLDIDTLNKLAIAPLSEREFEIYQSLLKGLSNQEIADTLFLSVNTIKFHLKNIYEKLEVKNRVQAVKLLLENPG